MLCWLFWSIELIIDEQSWHILYLLVFGCDNIVGRHFLWGRALPILLTLSDRPSDMTHDGEYALNARWRVHGIEKNINIIFSSVFNTDDDLNDLQCQILISTPTSTSTSISTSTSTSTSISTSTSTSTSILVSTSTSTLILVSTLTSTSFHN